MKFARTCEYCVSIVLYTSECVMPVDGFVLCTRMQCIFWNAYTIHTDVPSYGNILSSYARAKKSKLNVADFEVFFELVLNSQIRLNTD